MFDSVVRTFRDSGLEFPPRGVVTGTLALTMSSGARLSRFSPTLQITSRNNAPGRPQANGPKLGPP
jgi:hypothetical protein